MDAVPDHAVFDLAEIPFSTHGSWLDLSPVIGLHRTVDHVCLVSHQTQMHPVFRFRPTVAGGDEVTVTGTPAVLTWASGTGDVRAAFENVDTVRLIGRGLGMAVDVADATLTPFSGAYFFRDPIDGSFVSTVYETGRRYRITVLSGVVETRGDEALGTASRGVTVHPGPDGIWEIAVEETDTARAPYRPPASFDKAVAAADADFAGYLDAIAPWRDASTPGVARAAYVMWSATVRPAGFLTRESVLMSKHWMDSLWSWDHCFNALALAEGLAQQAWDQLLAPFDHQDASGALPDSITHSRVLRNFVKPPIHGWALQRLLTLTSQIPDHELVGFYDSLVAWTRFWTDSRTTRGHALPHYHHGNDSGWDNSTVFDDTRLVESADLAAFLVVQLRALADLAGRLGRADEARGWRQDADRLQSAMLEQLWDGHRFVTHSAVDGSVHRSRSLLTAMPIILGADLPPEVAASLAVQIQAHLTEHGLATEPVDSAHYEPDGYWRGPIWAPSTVLIEDGLRRAGYADTADAISSRFRRLCETHGFAENFDAVTGVGQRDRAYTWTASAYLLLAAASVARTADARR